MLSGNCTGTLSIQANVTISGSSAKLIKNGIAPLSFPLPALLNQYWYIKRGEGQGALPLKQANQVQIAWFFPLLCEAGRGVSLGVTKALLSPTLFSLGAETVK